MKKKLSVVACFGVAILMASCNTPAISSASSVPAASSNPGEGSSTTASSTTSIPDEDKITITYESVTGKNFQPYLDHYISTFNAAYPEYKVVSSIYSGSYDKLKDQVISDFSTGTYPDLVQAYPDHVAEYIAKGKAVKLDDYINDATIGLSTEDKNDYVPAFWEEGTKYVSSGTYSLPNSKSTELMFWNKDVLNGLKLNVANCGIDVNGGKGLSQAYFDELTWEEFFNVLCPALTNYNNGLADDKKILKTSEKFHSIMGYDSDSNLFITLAEQYGYDYTSIKDGKGSCDFVNDGMKSLMKTFHKGAKDGYIVSQGTTGAYCNTIFTKQNLLFSIGSTGGVKYQFDSTNPMDVGVARIPHAGSTNGKKAVISQGPSVAVLDHNDAKRSKGAYLFWKWMTNETNSVNWALNSGYMGIRKSCYTNQDYIDSNDETNFDLKTVDRLIARSNTYTQNILDEFYASPVFVGSSSCRTAAGNIMTWALNSSSDYTDADYDTEFATAYADAVKEIQ
jgi:multiple sugar transport system substrate-binding protein